MRKFFLVNSIGEEIDLNIRAHFFHSPNGLGVTNKYEFEDFGNGFYWDTYERQEQLNPSGEIAFLESDPYGDYQALSDWIYKGYDVSFVYAPKGTEKYYTDIKIDYFDKEEIKEGHLNIPIAFLGKTPWYKSTPLVFNFSADDETEYMIYDYPIEAMYALSNASNSIDIIASGHYPASFKTTIYGEFSNPIITVKTSSGIELGRLELSNMTIGANEYLEYSTIKNKCAVKKVGTAETSLNDYINVQYETFFTIPVGVPCTVRFESVGTPSDNTLYVYQYYRTV